MMNTLRRRSDGAVAIRGSSSRMSSTLLFDAASISTTSSARPSRMATQAAQRSHGSPSWRFVQLSALATIRAIEVLPVPRGPTNRSACATRSVRTALRRAATIGVLADDAGEGLGSPGAVDRLVRRRPLDRAGVRPRVGPGDAVPGSAGRSPGGAGPGTGLARLGLRLVLGGRRHGTPALRRTMDAVAARCGRRRPEIVIGRAPSVDPVFPMPIDP